MGWKSCKKLVRKIASFTFAWTQLQLASYPQNSKICKNDQQDFNFLPCVGCFLYEEKSSIEGASTIQVKRFSMPPRTIFKSSKAMVLKSAQLKERIFQVGPRFNHAFGIRMWMCSSSSTFMPPPPLVHEHHNTIHSHGYHDHRSKSIGFNAFCTCYHYTYRCGARYLGRIGKSKYDGYFLSR